MSFSTICILSFGVPACQLKENRLYVLNASLRCRQLRVIVIANDTAQFVRYLVVCLIYFLSAVIEILLHVFQEHIFLTYLRRIYGMIQIVHHIVPCILHGRQQCNRADFA